MAIDDRIGSVPQEVMERVRALAANLTVPPVAQAGDLTRASIEAMVTKGGGWTRELPSQGRLRFTGAGVAGSAADLEDIGMLSSAWQKAVSATGAALEGVQALRGRLPADVLLRTRLSLVASPTPGSVIFDIQPKQSPLVEAVPGGQPPLSPDVAARPLADRASEALVELLATASSGGPSTADVVSGQLRDLGPRVGSALTNLAHAIDQSNVTLEVSWQEPAAPTRRALVTPSQAKFISEVIEGRGLDAERLTLVGRLRTISDSQSWLLDLGEESVRLDARNLTAADLSRWRVQDLVEVDVMMAMQERPDGRVSRRYTITAIREGSGPLTLNANEDYPV